MSEPQEVLSETGQPSELDGLLTGARDALTDDMITRLSATATDGLDLLDRLNRSGVGDALPTLAQMVNNGDLQRVADLVRLVGSAQDALSDDIVSRLAQTAGDGLGLLDRLNRSGVGDALPTLAQMVNNGDLQRVADLVRLVGSAQDALSDDIVSRLAQTAGDGLDLLDRVNRSGIVKVLPAVTRLVENGDLDRLLGLARLVGSAQDALTDDMIGRLALMAGEMMCLVDRFARNPNFFRIIDLLGRDDVQSTLVAMLGGLTRAHEETATAPPTKGGLGGLLALARDPATQETLRFAAAFGRGLKNQKATGE
jgi:uncharacterized protein YjgD (DUF1641 family)